MRRLEILFVILLLLVGCHKKGGSNPASAPAPAPTPEKIEIKKVEDLCETGTLDDLFTKKCTTEQKIRFIEVRYGALDCDDKNKLDCDKIYEYIIDYDDLDLYKMLFENHRLGSYEYLLERLNLFNERCYDKKSVKVGSYFFKRNAKQIVDRFKINKKTIDIYNHYLDLGVDIDEENVPDKDSFNYSFVYRFLTREKLEHMELKEEYQKLVIRIIRSSKYFFPKLNQENKLGLDKTREFVQELCSFRLTIPVVELLNTIGPVVSMDLLIHPNKYAACLFQTETLEALLSYSNKESIKETGYGSRFLKGLMQLNSSDVTHNDFFMEDLYDSESGVKRYRKNKAMDILFNYFSIDDFFRQDKTNSAGLEHLEPFSYVSLRMLKILLIKISDDPKALENLRKLAKELNAKTTSIFLKDEYKLRYDAILKFIENQEEGLKFIENCEKNDKYYRY